MSFKPSFIHHQHTGFRIAQLQERHNYWKCCLQNNK